MLAVDSVFGLTANSFVILQISVLFEDEFAIGRTARLFIDISKD